MNNIKEKISKGMRIKCIHMDDPYPVPDGTIGIIKFVDDMGQIHVAWDNGSSLALIPEIDKFSIIGNKGGDHNDFD